MYELHKEVYTMKTKRNIEYEIRPEILSSGERWLTLKLKNTGTEILYNADIRLNSLDTYGLEIEQSSSFIPEMKTNEEKFLFFKIRISATTPVYITINGIKEDTPFYWESPSIKVYLSEDSAELVSLFAQRNEHILVGDSIKCEATVKSKIPSKDIILDIWTESPEGLVEDIETIGVDELEAKKTKKYVIKFSPNTEGIYTVHAELFDGVKRISKRVDQVFVESA